MDESPAYYDMVSTRLTINAEGDLLPMAVIFGGLKNKPKCQTPLNVLVYL